MVEVSLLHKKDLRFKIMFSISNYQDIDHGDIFEEEGELYINGSEIFFGNQKLWFRLDTKEILNVTTEFSDSSMQLECENFNVTFRSDDYTHLRVIRDALFLFMNTPLMYSEGPKGLPGMLP